jgi:hypothetical protein
MVRAIRRRGRARVRAGIKARNERRFIVTDDTPALSLPP